MLEGRHKDTVARGIKRGGTCIHPSTAPQHHISPSPASSRLGLPMHCLQTRERAMGADLHLRLCEYGPWLVFCDDDSFFGLSQLAARPS